MGSVSQQNGRGTVHLGNGNEIRIQRQGSRLQLVADLRDPPLNPPSRELTTDVAQGIAPPENRKARHLSATGALFLRWLCVFLGL